MRSPQQGEPRLEHRHRFFGVESISPTSPCVNSRHSSEAVASQTLIQLCNFGTAYIDVAKIYFGVNKVDQSKLLDHPAKGIKLVALDIEVDEVELTRIDAQFIDSFIHRAQPYGSLFCGSNFRVVMGVGPRSQ